MLPSLVFCRVGKLSACDLFVAQAVISASPVLSGLSSGAGSVGSPGMANTSLTAAALSSATSSLSSSPPGSPASAGSDRGAPAPRVTHARTENVGGFPVTTGVSSSGPVLASSSLPNTESPWPHGSSSLFSTDFLFKDLDDEIDSLPAAPQVLLQPPTLRPGDKIDSFAQYGKVSAQKMAYPTLQIGKYGTHFLIVSIVCLFHCCDSSRSARSHHRGKQARFRRRCKSQRAASSFRCVDNRLLACALQLFVSKDVQFPSLDNFQWFSALERGTDSVEVNKAESGRIHHNGDGGPPELCYVAVYGAARNTESHFTLSVTDCRGKALAKA